MLSKWIRGAVFIVLQNGLFLAIILVNEASAFQRPSEWALLWGRSRATLEEPESRSPTLTSQEPGLPLPALAEVLEAICPGQGPVVSLSVCPGRRETVVFRWLWISRSEMKSRRRKQGAVTAAPHQAVRPLRADRTGCGWGGDRSPCCSMNGLSDSGCRGLPGERT